MNKIQLLETLRWRDPFADFTPLSAPESWTWHYDRSFLEQVYQAHPEAQLVIEVGSWLGASAIKSTQYLSTQLGLRDFTLICVDTWLGNLEHWLRPQTQKSLQRQHGYPGFYEHFLSNIALSGLQDFILPFPQTSMVAARILSHHQLQADWIYLDASHDSLEVFFDLNLYWNCLKPGGTLMGDDWNWPSVRRAVVDFARDYGLGIHNSKHSWALFRPPGKQI